ncbi:MAG: calcium/sodium antiporter [Gammaproteobacteria bacterium]|nr:calcium/sodium antiporter [Gammaproteobacteria bacterium]
MWEALIAIIIGFCLLIWSADKFLSAAASIATNFGVSNLFIGLTVVSIGTSAPEIFVAITAAFNGNPLLAVGNAVGSNIANIGLVLGVTALIAPLPFSRSVLRTELPALLMATGFALFLLFDLELSALDGFLLLAVLGVILYRLVQNEKSSNASTDEISEVINDELGAIPFMSSNWAAFWIALGLIVLIVSARMLVWGATEVAVLLGVNEMIIGLTVVAVGTSLPELAATVGAAIKGHSDIAIGNVVGSNILNILLVLALPGLITPTYLENVALWRDCGMMLALTLLLALFAYAVNTRPVITRFEGAVMLLAWLGYNALLVQQVQFH